MGETEVREGVQPGQKVDLEAERKKREQAPKPRQKARAVSSPTGNLESGLKSFYETLVGAMYFVDSDVADFQAKHIDRMAATQAAWAKENPYVRRFLETLVSGGIAGAAIGEAVIVVGGSVMIIRAKQGLLDPRYMPAAAFFGIDLPEPVYRPEENPENPGGYPEDNGSGEFEGGPVIGEEAKDVGP